MFRFLLLADCQLGAYATFSGMTQDDVADFARRDMRVNAVPKVDGFAWDAERYERSIEIANQLRPEFVVVAGDMVDDISDEGQLEELHRITARLDGDIPMRWVPGNHDAAFDANVPTEESLLRYREIFGADRYAFTHGDTRFVVLNTVVLRDPQHLEGEHAEQLEFLRHELEASAEEGMRTILLGHHPLFLRHPEEPATYWNVKRPQRDEVLEMISSHGVPIAFAGHWHRNSIAFAGDFEMVTTGPVGYPLGNDPSGYRIVDVGKEVSHTYHPLPESGNAAVDHEQSD